MSNPCKLYPDNYPERDRKPFNKEIESELTKRVAIRHELLQKLALESADDVNRRVQYRAMKKALAEQVVTQHYASAITLNPNQYDHIGSFLARYFGQHKKLALFPNQYSLAGEVRYDLLQAARVADGLLDVQGKMVLMQRLRNLQQTINNALTIRGIKKTPIHEMMFHTIESGSILKHQSIYGNTPNVIAALEETYNWWVRYMVDIGLDAGDLPEILRAAELVASSFDDVTIMSEVFGSPINSLYNIGFIPRTFTPDFELRAQDILNKESLWNEVDLNRHPLSGHTIHHRSRTTWKYVAEDTEFLKRLTGLNSEQLNQLLLDGVAFRNYMVRNFTPSQLDLLVDSGVVSKLPMTSKEVFEYLTRNYDLPYRELNEMFIVDPYKAVQSYVGALGRSFRNANMVRYMIRDGLDAGWVATEKQVKNNPELARFVKLGAMDNPAVRSALADLSMKEAEFYVHPLVAEQFRGLAEIATSPAQLSNIARVWHWFTDFLRKSAIGSSNVVYIGHQFMSNIISLQAMGANPFNLLTAMWDILRASRFGVDHFDNVKPFRVLDGVVYTKKDFIENFFVNRGIPFTPLAPGERPTTVQWNSLNPQRLGRLFNYMWSYANMTPYGSPIDKGWRLGKYVGNILQDGLNDWYEIWAGLGSFIDLSARLAAYKSLSQTPTPVPDQIAQLIFGWSTKRFNKWDELNRYIDDYLINFDEIGSVSAFTSRFLRPFANWAMLNFPMQIRHMLRHPHKYLAYSRLIQLINKEFTEDDEISEGEFMYWDLDEYPIVIRRDPENKQTILLNPTNYDPLLSSVTFLKGLGETFSEMVMGAWPENTQKQRERLRAEIGEGTPLWVKHLRKMVSETYFTSPIEVLTGIDTYTGMPVKEHPWKDNTYLGLNLPTWAESLLSMLPPVDALDRWNPGGIFGVRELRDARTNEIIRPEKLSIFGTQRDRPDKHIGDAVDRDWALKILRVIGFRLTTVDGLANMQRQYRDSVSLATKLKTAINKAQEETQSEFLAGKLTKEQYAKREEVINDMIDKWLQLQWDIGRIEVWRVKNNVPDEEVFKRIKEGELAEAGLPFPGAKFLDDSLKEAVRMRQKMRQQTTSSAPSSSSPTRQ